MVIQETPRVLYKGNNKITELRTILQRESQSSQVYKQTLLIIHRIEQYESHKPQV